MFRGGAERAAAIIHAWLTCRTDGPWRVHHEVTIPGVESARADVWALRVSWTRLESWAFEIKVTKSDFRQDVDKGKWRKYLPACSRFFWVVPEGLVDKDEVPEGTGLIYVGGGVKVVQRSAIRTWTPSWKQLASLLFSIETPLSDHHRSYAPQRRIPAPLGVRRAHDVIEYDRKRVERDIRRRKVDEWCAELEGKAKGLKDLEQLRADTYTLQRKLDVVQRVLGLYGNVNENDLAAALQRHQGASPAVHRGLRGLVGALGYDLVEKKETARSFP